MNMRNTTNPILKKTLALLVLTGTLGWQATVHAEDLMVLVERSKGTQLTGNGNTLANKETLQVAAKGRVWAVKKEADASFNLICMNQTNAPLTLRYNEEQQPWLADNGASCSAQNDSVYSCKNEAQNTTLMCRTQLVAKQAGGMGITDMTAVALRSLDNSDEAFYRIANSVMEQHKLHFDLCQDMHGKHSKGGLSFVIQASGAIENIEIIKDGQLTTPSRSEDYAECMAQAIELWRFPTLDYIYEMEYAFVN